MDTTSGLRLRRTLFGLLLWMVGSVAALADDPFGGSAAHSTGGLQLSLTTNKGAGPNAVFKNGEGITIFYRTGKPAILNLRIEKPNGTSILVRDLEVQEAGFVYRFDSFVGLPLGDRTVILEGRSGGLVDRVELTFRVSDQLPKPLVLHLKTNRGCGALFQRGDDLIVEFSVSVDATLRLIDVRPDGEERVVRDSFAAEANRIYVVEGRAGTLLGERTLILDANDNGRTAQARCSFTVVAELPPPKPLITFLKTNKGRDNGAIFSDGEPFTVTFEVSETALVRLTYIRPNGSFVAGDWFRLQADTPHSFDGVTESTAGTYTLRLEAKTATRSDSRELTFEVVSPPLDNSIILTLTTNRGSGPGAVFHPDELMAIDFTVSADANLRMQILGPGSSEDLVSQYPAEPGRRYRFIIDVGDVEGTWKIILSARGAGSTAGQAEITFVVDR